MYETALPDETRQRLNDMGPAGIVVGIPSYRNSRTVGLVVEKVAQALHRHYAHLRPVIVHADGHSFDDTLSVASHVPLPPSVRRVATRYQGLPGKGSALRAIFEIATVLESRAVAIVEADVTSFEPAWLPALVDPILADELDFSLPLYRCVRPPMASADLLIYPLLATLFHITLRYAASGEIAMAGGVATYFSERDVWETDVARDGIDLWMPVEVALEEGRIGQVHLGCKNHRSHDSATLAEAKFLQEIGTLFRMGHLQEKVWRRGDPPAEAITTLGTPEAGREKEEQLTITPGTLWRSGVRAVKGRVRDQWDMIMTPEHIEQVETLLRLGEETPSFDDWLWARLVYDFVVVYNQGEGDPDKVITALYPLFQMRNAVLLKDALEMEEPFEKARETLVQRQLVAFQEEYDYFLQRWENYVSPEQLELWRDLGILPQ